METGTLKIVFSPMYSAFVPGHDARLPVKVDGKSGSDVTFTAADATLVDIMRTADGAMLTMKKAGKTTITAKVGNETGTAQLTITEYTAEEWEAGNKRYNSGTGLGLADAGVSMGPPGGGAPTISPDTACASCHGATAEVAAVIGSDIEHTPTQTGGYSEDELFDIFTMGKKPSGVGQHTPISPELWQMLHKWNVTQEQKRGVVAYLRTLTPENQATLTPPPRFDGGIPRVPDAGR